MTKSAYDTLRRSSSISCRPSRRLDLTSFINDYTSNGANRFSDLAFPETEDVPPRVHHVPGSPDVSLLITLEFRSPGIAIWTVELSHTMLGAIMPETSVDHHDQLLGGEGEVGLESLSYGPIETVSYAHAVEMTP